VKINLEFKWKIVIVLIMLNFSLKFCLKLFI
jgi:hypothetical protein